MNDLANVSTNDLLGALSERGWDISVVSDCYSGCAEVGAKHVDDCTKFTKTTASRLEAAS